MTKSGVLGAVMAMGLVGTAHADAALTMETQLAKHLGSSARYSALQTRGKPTPFCQAQKYDGAPMRLWEWDAKGGDLTCFKPGGTPEQHSSIDSFRHASSTVLDLSTGDLKDGFAWGLERDGDKVRIWAIESADIVTYLRVPLKAGDWLKFPKAKAVAEGAMQTQNATADVFTKDAASAKTVDLEAGKKRLLARIEAVGAAQAAQTKAEEDAKLEKTAFPKAGMNSPSLVKNLTAYFKQNPDKTDIDPGNVKKMKVTSKAWTPRKDQHGFTLGQTAEVTVGFARPDGRCAFVSYTLQRDYLGKGKYQAEKAAYPNGFASGWTGVKCDRIK